MATVMHVSQFLMSGDINGDGRDDIVGRTTGGAWWGAISTGSAFTNTYLGAWTDPGPWVNVMIGDLTGDGKADVFGRNSVTGQWLAGISSGTAFTNRVMGAWDPSIAWLDVMTGDFNGDGRADVVGRTSGGVWWAGITTPDGTAFANRAMGSWSTGVTWLDVMVGDYNGDGRDDVLGRTDTTGQWWAGITNATATAFTNRLMGRWSPTVNWTNVRTGDFNRNGIDDIAGQADYGTWWGGISNGSTFTNQLQTWATSPAWGTGMAFNQAGRTTTAPGAFNGTIVLPDAANNVGQLSLQSRGRTVVYNDAVSVAIGAGTAGIDAGQVIFSAGGPISQTQPIRGTSLSLVSTSGDVALG
ncbi:VCBS repeat-containing protein, partial [bacterium]|nr:VCBS repeat-containing protein [bacterium]